MLKNLSLSILTALVLVSVSYADEGANVKFVSIDESPISYSDVAAVSTDWSAGNTEIYSYMLNSFHPKAAEAVLKALPELRNNKKALVSVTMGFVMMSDQIELDFQKTMMHLSTHKYLANQADVSLKDVVNALKSMSI